MKDLLIDELVLEHFKCHDYLELKPRGRDQTLYLPKGAGAAADALSWLLYGKNRQGREDREVRPLKSSGALQDPGAVTQVTAVLSMEGKTRELRKALLKKPGGGFMTQYYVDGIPCGAQHYREQVEAWIPEELYFLLSDPLRFLRDLSPRQQQAILCDAAALPEDRQLLKGDSRFEALLKEMDGLSLEETGRKLLDRLEDLQKSQNDLPLRISEEQRILRQLGICDYEAMRKRRDCLEKRREAVIRQPEGEPVLKQLNLQIRDLDQSLGGETFHRSCAERIRKLRQDLQKIQTRVSALNRQLILLQEFLKLRTALSEQRIRTCFSPLTVHLQGKEPGCRISYRGIPWENLSAEEQEAAGRILLEGLSRHYGIRVPLFLRSQDCCRGFRGSQSIVLLKTAQKEGR